MSVQWIATCIVGSFEICPRGSEKDLPFLLSVCALHRVTPRGSWDPHLFRSGPALDL
jgi:hypothetical protein